MTLPDYSQLLEAVIVRAELSIVYERVVYGRISDEKLELVPGDQVVRWVATCPQIPSLKMRNPELEKLKDAVTMRILRSERFCLTLDGIEIISSPLAFHEHGLLKPETTLSPIKGKYENDAHVVMSPSPVMLEQHRPSAHRFHPRSMSTLPNLYFVLKAHGAIREVVFQPALFEKVLCELI